MSRFLAFVGVLVLLAAAQPAVAQRMSTERVRFARGESESTVTHALRRGESVRLLVGASSRQTLSVERSGGSGASDCTLGVYAPGRPIRDSYALASAYDDGPNRARRNAWTGRLSRTGDYQIVLTNRGGSGDCGVWVRVD